MTLSDCGAGRFLVALLGSDSQEQVKRKLGITQFSLDGLHFCQCGKRLNPKNKSGYCRQCLTQAVKIDVSCSECGKLFKQRAKYLIWKLNHGQEHFFCSRQCLGNWVGRHYGFTTHPENIVGGRNRKWDWDLVWQKHLETGYGAVRLSPILGIPTSTIDYILRRKDENLSCLRSY